MCNILRAFFSSLTAAINSIEMYAFSYYYDRAVEMGLIGRDKKSLSFTQKNHLHYIIYYILEEYYFVIV